MKGRIRPRLAAAWRALTNAVEAAPVAPRAAQPGPRGVLVMKRGVFDGALASRLQAFTGSGLASPDQEVAACAPGTRAAARDLEKNNPFVRRYLDNLCDGVVGDVGLRMIPQVRKGLAGTGAKPELDDATNRRIKEAWSLWGEQGNPTIDGRHSWISLLRLVTRTVARDGEVFIRKVRDRRHVDGFTLQLVDADLVDAGFNVPPRPGSPNWISQGIELDPYGRPVAYWVGTYTIAGGVPSGISGNRERVPAEDMIHIFEPLRPGQTRGITWLHAALTLIEMVGAYWTAEVTAARGEAERLGFLETASGEGIAGKIELDDDGNPKPPEIVIESEAGTYQALPPGVKATMPDVKHPTTAFAEFSKALLKGFAASVSSSYASVSGDLADVNFSSIRHGAIEERGVFRRVQKFLAEQAATPIARAWVESAWMVGGLRDLSGADLAWAKRPTWRGRGWDWVDPLKDVKAKAMEVDAGFTSRSAVVASKGEDLEDVLEQQAADKAMAEDLGLVFGPVEEPSIPLGDVNENPPGSASNVA